MPEIKEKRRASQSQIPRLGHAWRDGQKILVAKSPTECADH